MRKAARALAAGKVAIDRRLGTLLVFACAPARAAPTRQHTVVALAARPTPRAVAVALLYAAGLTRALVAHVRGLYMPHAGPVPVTLRGERPVTECALHGPVLARALVQVKVFFKEGFPSVQSLQALHITYQGPITPLPLGVIGDNP